VKINLNCLDARKLWKLQLHTRRYHWLSCFSAQFALGVVVVVGVAVVIPMTIVVTVAVTFYAVTIYAVTIAPTLRVFAVTVGVAVTMTVATAV